MQNISFSIAADLLKNKAIFIYGLLLAVLGWGMFLIESQPEKTILASFFKISYINRAYNNSSNNSSNDTNNS